MFAKSDKKTESDNRLQFEAEAARQFALERYDILDTAQENSFDHIANAVKLALDVPSVGVSFLDGERLWFKSKIGLTTSEVPRDSSFCDYAIRQNSPMIIVDTLQDARFRENPAVICPPFFRSYIGVPLTTPDGHNIGTLCAMDIVPRQYSRENVERMGQLAELVIHELELRQQANKDRLTGALTRSGFFVEVQKAISLYDRQKIKSTLVLFDIDLYKMVDHRFESPSGNAMLRAIIEPLSKRLRQSDCIGRMGGTQFAILLTCTTKAKAMRATEEFQQKMEHLHSSVLFDVSFCEISSEMGICHDWLEQANINLQLAKQADRNETDEVSDRQCNLAG